MNTQRMVEKQTQAAEKARAAGNPAPACSPRTIVACMHSRRTRPGGGSLITLLVHPTEDAKFPADDVAIVTVTW